jgi:hypothetical protein
MKSVQIIMIAVVCAALASPALASKKSDDKDEPKLKGSEEGTVLESMTVEGEDRVSVRFERPELRIAVDPATAPGLDWESLAAVLDGGHLGLIEPLIARSAFDRSSRIARPWLDTFRQGPVAKFQPKLEGVESWKLAVADSRGREVIAFTGKGKPPKQIEWDGLDASGKPVAPGLVYSFSVEASDKAGNTRNFVGEGFEVPAYIVNAKGSAALMFSAETLREDGTLLEAASRINQINDTSLPVFVEVTAPSGSAAKKLAEQVAKELGPMLLGDPNRLTTTTHVDKGEEDRASIAIRIGGR